MNTFLLWCRALAFLTLTVLVGGLVFWALLEGWVYLDGMQAEQTAGRLRLSLMTVLPGLVAGIIVWGMTLFALARTRRWIGFALALLPLVPIVADVIGGPFLPFGPAYPYSPAARALELMIWSGWMVSGLLLVLCFVLRDAEARSHAS